VSVNFTNTQKPVDIEKSSAQQLPTLEKGLITVVEAAKFLSLSRSTIYNLMDSGRLRYVKIGGSRRIPWQCCLELIQSHLIGGWNLQANDRDLKISNL
jgi:excisionase family DNA binding protein